MKKPSRKERYKFKTGNVEYDGVVLDVYPDPKLRPYGVVIELLCENKPKDLKCLLEGKEGQEIKGTVDIQWSQSGIYRLDIIANFPYDDFWELN